jgi:hypothetical protein
MKKYHLVLCELHYTPLHGKTEESDPNIEGHYLLIGKFNPRTDDILNDSDYEDDYQTDSDDSDDSDDRDNSDNSDDDDDDENVYDENNYRSSILRFARYTTQYNQNNNHLRIINVMTTLWNYRYKHLLNTEMLEKKPHPVIRNYKNIIANKNYIRPEIAQCIKLSTDETIVIIKTFWLKIIQRTWKNILQKRKSMIKDPSFILKLQMSYNSYKSIPSLKGMLRFSL